MRIYLCLVGSLHHQSQERCNSSSPRVLAGLCVSRFEIADDDESVLILGPGLPIHAGWNQSLNFLSKWKEFCCDYMRNSLSPRIRYDMPYMLSTSAKPHTVYRILDLKKERNVRKSELPSASFTWDFWGPHRKYMKYTRRDIRSPLEQTTPLGTGGRLDV